MKRENSLAGKFLVAMPTLEDNNFERTVLFVCSHDSEGALGLVINQPHPAPMDEVIGQLNLEWRRDEGAKIVYQGGPVSLERGFVLFEQENEDSTHLKVGDSLFLGTDPDILRTLVEKETSNQFFFALGYSGWAKGQLEREIRENAWLIANFDRRVLFDLPSEGRWTAALWAMGIDPAQLVDGGGSHLSN
ncbi:MAG: YqgE/AlgH family protein [Magnetococcales bacterium]|nr:YqgE/AlgH family protein [Magnetococcales bacterium]